MDISELSKKAVLVLVQAQNPEFVISKAREFVENDMRETVHQGIDRWEKDNKSTWWEVVFCKDGWMIERNNVFKQYRLAGPNNHTYFSIQKKNKLEKMLEKIIDFGSSQNDSDSKSTMPVYQVVVSDKIAVREGCERLLLEDVTKLFPDTKNPCSGFYTNHPCNCKALTPIENYFTNLALDKDTECVVLIGKFGAKSVHIKRSEVNKKNSETNANASVKAISVDANAGGQIRKELSSEVDFKAVFQAKPTNVTADILKQSLWFKNDSQMNGLLESLLSSNPPKEWEYVEKNVSTFNFDFNAAANILNVTSAKLESEYEKVKNIERHFHVVF